MFRDDTTAIPRTKLYVIAGGRQERAGIALGEIKMNAFKFAAYPSNDKVATGVTLLVSVWFLVAAGAILSDPSSPYTQPPQIQAAAPAAPAAQVIAVSDRADRADSPVPTIAIAPEARLTITVEASRAASLRSVNL
jgi:hypothetical protein